MRIQIVRNRLMLTGELTQDILKELLTYNPITGVFTWLVNIGAARVGGHPGIINSKGYLTTFINKKHYSMHRLAFLYMTGSIPEFVDHINGIRDDNRWENLRPANIKQNGWNRKINSNNKSGYKGVHFQKCSGKWVGQVRVGDKKVRVGTFNSAEEAAKEVMLAREKYHGEFCNHGD